MKNILATAIAVLAFTQISYGQWATSGAGNAYNNNSTGKVGVGLSLTDPQTLLEINSNSYTAGNQLMLSGLERTRYSGLLSQTVAAGITIFSLGTISNFINYGQTLNLYNGNVGIGTLNPAGKVHIIPPLDGTVSALTIGDNSKGNPNVPVGSSPGGYNIDFHGYRDIVAQIGARIRAERINRFDVNNPLIQGMDLAFSTSQGIDQSYLLERLRIKYDGKVGIGTATPDEQLTVKGKIHAEEVRIDLNFPAPDYVFQRDYKLLNLDAVKAYIAEHRHLPEVPSAKKMEKEGINLSEMNMLLLKKIEELTLYVIQQKEENATIKTELSKIKQQQDARIAALEKALKK
ncbi:MAG: hypothetical protein V4619_00170 [Bacteroidota bacterium]